jgi:H/ACA ribonucleoprotein complex subunit 4
MLGKATLAVPALRSLGKEYVCHLKLHRAMPQKTGPPGLRGIYGSNLPMPPIKIAVKRVIE